MQNIIILTILLVTIIGLTSTFHYKSRLEKFTMKKHINDKSTMRLVREITDLAKDIRIATYPGECNILTKEIVGDDSLEDKIRQRVIIATGDPNFKYLLVFSHDPIEKGVKAINEERSIFTDINITF